MKIKMQFTKQTLSILLVLVMVLGMLPLILFTVQAAPTTDADGYYLINNEEDLFAFAELVNSGENRANARLTANIAMTGQDRPWTPIASYSGTFDGQGYVISNLYSDHSDNAGLFGVINGGTVKNVTVSGGSITAPYSYSGAIAGRLWNNGVIEGCGNLNTTVSGYFAGGIVGEAGGTILASWNTGTVSSEHWIGGICGVLSGTVRGCWNSGQVTAPQYSGGIVGVIRGADTISHCYNDGDVEGEYRYSGAIVGLKNSAGDWAFTMSNCYYTSGSAYNAYGLGGDWRFPNVDSVDNSMLPTGEAALLLNGGLTGTDCKFYQNLDIDPVDAYPVLDSTHGTVYSGYKPCNTGISYSNSPLSGTFYHSGFTYTKDGVTIREVCTNQSCENPTKDLGSVTLKASDAYYTGNPVSATAESSLTGGGTYKITYNNGATTAPSTIGTHTATLILSENGAKMERVTAEYKISYLPAPSPAYSINGYAYEDSGVYWFKDGTTAQVLAPAGYSVSTASDGDYGASVTLSESDSKAVYLRRDSDGALTDAIDLSTVLRFDGTAPTGRIALSAGNAWEDLLSQISVGLFFKEAETATVTAEDTESGVNTIAYYIASEDLIADNTLDGASAIEKLKNAIAGNWESYTGEIALNQNATNIVYVRITDNVGNVTYLSTDGVECDNTAPVISGVESGKIYYTTQKVTVTDKNLGTVTLNGEAVTSDITLEGNKEATYTIVAADKAGNTTTVSVTMEPISCLSEPIDALNKDNVNSGNEQTVDGVKAAVAAVDTASATDAEKEALKAISDKAAALEKVMDDTRAEITRITEELKKYDSNTVNSDDAEALEQLLADIEKQLESTNLTTEEISELNGDKKTVEELLTKIKGTDELIDKLIEDVNGYTEETVKSTDKDAIEQLIENVDALLETENLTKDEEKALEDSKTKAEGLLDAIEDAAKAADTENIEKVKGVTAENVKPEDKTDLENAKEALEKALDEHGGNYTEEEKKAIENELGRMDDALEVIGNVEAVEEQIENLPDTITKDDTDDVNAAKKAYDELSDYEKTLVDPDVEKKLEDAVKAAEVINKPADTNSPQTGDNSHMALWIALLFIRGGAVITLTVYDRKRRKAVSSK